MREELQKIEAECAADAQRYVNETADGHDEFQLKNFIMGMNGLTDYGHYRQACREVSARFESMKGTALQYDKVKLNAELNEHKAKRLREASEGDPIERELKAKIYDNYARRNRLEMDTQERMFKRQVREFLFFLEEARKWEKAIEGKDRSQLIEDFWIAKVRRLVTLNTVGGGNALDGAVEMIMAMPEKLHGALFGMLDEMKYRAKVNEIGLQGAALKALEGPGNIVTLNGKK